MAIADTCAEAPVLWACPKVTSKSSSMVTVVNVPFFIPTIRRCGCFHRTADGEDRNTIMTTVEQVARSIRCNRRFPDLKQRNLVSGESSIMREGFVGTINSWVRAYGDIA